MLFLILFFFLLEWKPPPLLELKIIKGLDPVENVERWSMAFKVMQKIFNDADCPYRENFIQTLSGIYADMTTMECFAIYEYLNPREVFEFLFPLCPVSIFFFNHPLKKKNVFYLSSQK